MVKWLKTVGLALLSGGLLTAGPPPPAVAATSATLDILPGEGAGDAASSVDLGSLRPILGPSQTVGKLPRSRNPLWVVPFSVLGGHAKPPDFLGLPTPAAARCGCPAGGSGQCTGAPEGGGAERPPLALIAAVVGESDATAVFLDRTSQKIVRLRQGEARLACWLLATSLLFYGWWSFEFLWLLIGSIAFNFSMSMLLWKSRLWPKLVLATGIAGNLIVLFVFKHIDLFINALDATGLVTFPPLHLRFQ